jgi:hypothetical protein
VNQKAINLVDKTPVVERAPEDLSKTVIEELISLVRKFEDQAATEGRSASTYWQYRVPSPGVRYCSYE